MKKHYLLFLIVLAAFSCKKNHKQIDDTITPAPGTMHLVISSNQMFSYNITESDTVTNEFTVTDGYDKTSLDYYFTPLPGHKVVIEAITNTPGTITGTITYKDKPLGPITSHDTDGGTGFEYSYSVPK